MANYYLGNLNEAENDLKLAIELDSTKFYLADYYTALAMIHSKRVIMIRLQKIY